MNNFTASIWQMSPPVPVLCKPPKPERVLVASTPDLERIRSALTAIPNDGANSVDYDTYRNLAFAVHHATTGSDEGLEVFREFSARSPKHDDEFLEQRIWQYINDDRSGEVITERTLFNLAEKQGWVDPSIADDFEVIEEAESRPEPADALVTPYAYRIDRLSPVEYLIDGFLSNGLTVIAGAPGVGKTSLLVPLAAAVAQLFDSALRVELRRKVVYFSEAPEQVECILYALAKKAPGAKSAEFADWFQLVPARRLPAAKLAKVIRWASRSAAVDKNGYPVAPLVVLDTSNANVDVDNENDNAEVGRVISAIKENLGRGACWLVHHTAKALTRADVDDLTARGAGAFAGDANATAFVFEEPEIANKRFMKTRKVRFEADFSELEFETYTASEAVTTPWGNEQWVRYRYGIPAASSAARRLAEREQAKEFKASTRDAERMGEIGGAVVDFLREAGPSSRNAIEKGVRKHAADVRRCIEQMLEAGEVVENGKGRGGGILYGLPN